MHWRLAGSEFESSALPRAARPAPGSALAIAAPAAAALSGPLPAPFQTLPCPQQPQRQGGEEPRAGSELLGALRSQNRELQVGGALPTAATGCTVDASQKQHTACQPLPRSDWLLCAACPSCASQSGAVAEHARHSPPPSNQSQRVRQELEALKSQGPSAAPALQAAPAPAPAAVAPSAPAPAAAEAEEAEEGGSAFAALNLVGILAAGGLYGYQTIQKKQAAEAEAAYQQKLKAGERPPWPAAPAGDGCAPASAGVHMPLGCRLLAGWGAGRRSCTGPAGVPAAILAPLPQPLPRHLNSQSPARRTHP